jgi:transcriptional regulator with XRE-family HTH domain
MDVRQVVGKNIRRIRAAAGISQEELATRMGVDQGYVSSLEAGKRNPTVVTLWHAAVALGVTPDRFLKHVARPQSSKSS